MLTDRKPIIQQMREIMQFVAIAVIPLSSLVVKDNQPYRYPISKRQKLEKKSDACIYEIRSLSKNRVGEKVATITKGELEGIRQALCDLL